MDRRKPGTTARFKCEYCGETFTRHYNLKGHIRAHKNERPFVCEFPGCEKAFARAHDRKRHQLLHTGEKKYKCDVCQTAFVRLDALQRHRMALSILLLPC
ncbi:hypothetical protein BT69DRAFT_1220287 [Atractiella rhizophila]|nr:hypothetical protein BT69DRAFT_1220287 [Atractiella rhizophila]